MATAKKAVKKAPAKRTKREVAPRAKAPKKEKKELGALEAQVYTMDGKTSGTVALPADVFGAPWNADLVHQVVLGMQANARPTIAHTKFRGEVRGGGKKPWKQKGTGRARHGSRRSPIWVGGGTTHGPRAERDYSVKINRKMRSVALASLLSKKFKEGEVIFVDALSFAEPKTKLAKDALVALAKASGQAMLADKRKNAVVIALFEKNRTAEKSFSNIGSLITEEVRNLNPVELVTKKYVIIERPADSVALLSSRVTK